MSSAITVEDWVKLTVWLISKSWGVMRTGVPGPCRMTAFATVFCVLRWNGSPNTHGLVSSIISMPMPLFSWSWSPSLPARIFLKIFSSARSPILRIAFGVSSIPRPSRVMNPASSSSLMSRFSSWA